MDSTQFLEAHASTQSLAQTTAQDYSYTLAAMDHKSPNRPLRSHSRKHRSIPLSSGHALFNKPASRDSSEPQPHLRRVQAFSDLVESVGSSFAPVVSVSVAKDDWLEESVAKTKRLLKDKEMAEQMARRVRGVPSIQYLGMGQDSVQLRRKRKSQDLRSEYGSDGDEEKSSPPVSALPLSGHEEHSPNSADDDNTTIATINSDNSTFARTPPRFYSLSRRASDPLPAKILACSCCGNGFFIGGGGNGGQEIAGSDDTSSDEFTDRVCPE
ncbi:hypothetical protein M409DRAFT_28290 [Zasmidium cellare ATCC 36951]|uniref:Uncharacterized protein n=1 Tax=Zasmidium cellare ATCC 36951 TaxID=1080233 RepID=A0A6A6C2H9_ZASCE|nr:uncharacterized protein M409DRAFT_28290 [Zasmidium cellare ATCC 36951]KAF2161251.1 hypothetical protein M409DRAFT_28290 [Zasmidium cellare ATCC 36951]